jgi:hypothetical protein
MKTKIALAIAYLMMAAFTYGFVYNAELKFQTAACPDMKGTNEVDSQMVGLICSAVWPIYWPFHCSKAMWANKLK